MKTKPKILVIDDDPNVRKTLSDILGVKGYETAVAASGAEAIAAAEHEPPTLALIDLMLPDMPGLEVMARIKAISPLTEAIILTGHASIDTAIEATNRGAFSYLLKPYQMDDLLLAIRQGVERHQAQEEILRLASFPQFNPSPVIELDRTGKVTYANPAAEKWFPDLSALGLSHPLLHGLTGLMTDLWQSKPQGEVAHETEAGEATYELHISYVQEVELIRIYVTDITEHKRDEEQLKAQFEKISQANAQLRELNKQLSQTQNLLLQSEKMASIGQLAAGVAHEINNPIGYVNSNLGTLGKYLADIFALLAKYEEVEVLMEDHSNKLEELRQLKKKTNPGYLMEDANALLAESQQGLERVKQIILDLKNFSRTGTEEPWTWADIQKGLESTLNIIWNELKYKCELKKEYGTLPLIYCLPSQLNQVFMNLLVNASQATEERGVITLRTGQENDLVWVEVADTGKGIPPEILTRIFDPFFTTKPVGQGVGLGLSVSYSIVEKHHGRIEVESEVGRGTVFRVWLPIKQPGFKETA